MDPMDQELLAKIGGRKPGKSILFSVGHDTHFVHGDKSTVVRYVAESGATIEHELRSIADLAEGDAPFDTSGNDGMDAYLPLLTAIESGINVVQRTDPDLKDKTVITVLERLVAKPDMPLGQELPTAIQDRMRLILSVDRYSKREVVGCIRKVLKSARLHHADGGPRGYLDFIRERI